MALNLDKIAVYEFLNELGLNNVREDGKDIWYSCFSDAHHRGDVNPSASMEQGTTRFYCFSCGMSGNAVSFLSELENVSPIQSAIWIKERFGGVGAPDRSTILDNVKDILNKPVQDRSRTKKETLEETEALRRRIDWKSEKGWLAYSGDKISSSDTHVIYMLDRGFDDKVLDKFEIGWDKISERIAIPVRDDEGQLVGFKGRAIDNERQPRYLVLGGPEYGFEPYSTKEILFGLPQAIKSKKYEQTGELIICEGELNAIAMHQRGFDNTVGISGKILSAEQVTLVKKYAKNCVLVFDEQEDTIAAAKKLRGSVPTSITREHDQDPADMDEHEILSLLSQRKSSLLS